MTYTRFSEAGNCTGVVSDMVGFYKNITDQTVNGVPPYSTAEVDWRTGRVVSSEYSYMKGVDLPNFHARKRAGELLPFTAYEQVYCKSVSSAGTYRFKETETGNEFWWDKWYPPGDWRLCPNKALGYITNGNQDVLQEAAARIYNSSFDLLTFLAELRKTIAMFTQLLGRLIKGFLAVHPDDWDKWWLEVRYGWRPFILEMAELAEIMGRTDAKRTRHYARAGASTVIDEFEDTIFGDYVSTALSSTMRITDRISLSRRGSVVADVELPDFSINPVTTAWELITLSFVIDWFLSVGDALATISLALYADDHVAASGNKVTVTRDVELIDVEAASGVQLLTHTFSASSEVTLVQRVPSSVSYIPQFKVDLDLDKLRDLLSLFRSILNKGVR